MRPLLILLVGCVLSSCSLFGGEDSGGEDFDDLAPGTFRMEADGEDYAGTASYFRDRFIGEGDSATALEPVLSLETERGDLMSMKGDALLNAEAGGDLDIHASFRPASGGVFTRRGGSVRIAYADSTRIEGTFRFRMEDIAMGCLGCRTITVEGGFNATVEE